MYSGVAVQLIRDIVTSLVCSKRKPVDMLFNILDGELSNIGSTVASVSETSFISYDYESDAQRSPARHTTRCLSGNGGGKNRGKSVVDTDILNSVSNLRTNIIYSATQAAAVILPSLTNILSNLVGLWLNPGQTPQNPQQPLVISPTPTEGQLPPEQWLPKGGQLHPVQWVPPGGPQPREHWVTPGGQTIPGQWVKSGEQQPISPLGQWMPPGGQDPPFPHPPQGNCVNILWDHQYPNQDYTPASDVNVHVGDIGNSTASSNVGYPLALPSTTKSIKTQNNSQPVSQSTQSNLVYIPGRYNHPNQRYHPVPDVKATTNGSNVKATMNLNKPSSSPYPTSSYKTQDNSLLTRSPPFTRSSLLRSSPPKRSNTQNVSQLYSADSYPGVHKCYRNIHKTRQDICINV